MKVAVLVSGGVDSSVALALLKQQGHDVTAFYLKIWLEDELSYLGDCPWEQDLAHVRAVCEQLDVPVKVISLQREYHEHIVAYTINEVKQGRTPNPDIFCNQRIKFGLALDKIGDGFDKIASGHYAWTEEKEGRTALISAPDTIKDQTYFLSYLSQDQLKKLIFPIGKMDKAQVREAALQFNLSNATRKDSQGICFLGKLKFSDFLKHYLGEQSGDMIEFETGKVMGTHRGFWYYTIGQRQGLGLAGGPWYVVTKDPKSNAVFISREYYTKDKQRDQFVIEDCNWISKKIPVGSSNLEVKLRHGAQRYRCSLSTDHNDQLIVKLTEQDQGIAPGQFAVFYDGDQCLGSGIIAYVPALSQVPA